MQDRKQAQIIRQRGRRVPQVRIPPKLLVVGDFPVFTGFGTVLHNLLPAFKKEYDLYVMGINYYGDYNEYVHEYKIWPAAQDNDVYGYGKLYHFIDQLKPDLVLIVNDPWCAINYEKAILKYKEKYPNIGTKFYLYAPIDAVNVKRAFVEPLNKIYDAVIAYTNFGQLEFIVNGLTVPSYVIPHGVNTDIYKPMQKAKAKAALGSHIPADTFIFLTVCRNSMRKRLDLTMSYFAEWVHTYNIPPNVRWYYHGQLHDQGIDVLQYSQYLGINDRLIVTGLDHTAESFIPVEHMNVIYNAADVFYATPTGEGWGLPIMEAMATRTAALIPDHSALSEWPKGGVHYMSATEPIVSINGLNTEHRIPDRASAIAGMQSLYESAIYRDEIAQKGYELVNQPKFRWDNIAKQFMDIFEGKVK